MSGKISGDVIPTNFGLKYNPPKLGIQYYFKENEKASFVHEIPLNFVSKYSDPEEVARELFKTNSTFLNQARVSMKQVETLVTKLQQTLYPRDNKENIINKVSSAPPTKSKPAVFEKEDSP